MDYTEYKAYNYVITEEFDPQGNLTYAKFSNGSWVRSKYDSMGNEVEFENSDGDALIREFDHQNRLVYF